MWTSLFVALVLAQADGGAPPAAAPAAPAAAPAGAPADPAAQPAGPGSLLPLFGPIALAFALMMWMNSRQTRKDQDRKKSLITNLKKNDTVITIGGIIGSFVSRSEDGLEVTLKMVDDARIKFRADAIRDVVTAPDAVSTKS